MSNIDLVEVPTTTVVEETKHTPADRSPSDSALVSELVIAPTNSFAVAPNTSAKILVVDDEPACSMVVRKHLQAVGYQNVIMLHDAPDVVDTAQKERPDVVLLDILMPDMSGLEILQEFQLDPELAHIPVLILTTATSPGIKQRALKYGANDYLSKPVDPNELVLRVRNALIIKEHHDHLARYTEQLDREVKKRTAELAASRREIIHCLARAAEFRDDDTGHHIIRVGAYAGIISRELGFSDERAEMLELAAQLHDVGKIGIPDAILLKPGKLEPEEYDFIRRHCGIGKKIMETMPQSDWGRLKSHTRVGANILNVRSSPLMMLATRIAQTHHEKWDGSGYPLGLAADDIPIEGRITAVADVFDALSTKRLYKPAFSRQKCFEIMEEGRAAHFDPKILDAFFASSDTIIEVQMQYMDIE